MNRSFFVQICYELLPVSSSGHVEIARYFFNFDYSFVYDLLAHLPTAFIIILFFFIFMQDVCFSSLNSIKKFFLILFSIIFITFFSALPSLYSFFLKAPFCSFTMPLWFGFLLTTIILFSFIPFSHSKNKESIMVKDMFVMTMAQTFTAAIPGVSRFALTLYIGKLLGYSARWNFFFTLLLNIGISCAGGCFCLLLYLIKGSTVFGVFCWTYKDSFLLCMSMIVAFMQLVIVWELYRKNTLWVLAFYELIITIIAFYYGL